LEEEKSETLSGVECQKEAKQNNKLNQKIFSDFAQACHELFSAPGCHQPKL
jgi:hypothetical protein